MKRISLLLIVLAALCLPVFAADVGDDMTFEGPVTIKDNPITYQEITAPSTNPDTGKWYLYFDSSGLAIKDDAGTTTAITTGSGDNTLDNAYDQGGAGAGRSITADNGAVAISNTDADSAFLFTLNAAPSGSAALGGAQITVGANSTQDALEFANSGAGFDIYGTSGTWTVSNVGALTAASADLSGTFAADGAITLGNGASTVEVNSTSWIVSTAGAFSGVADITGTAGAPLGITLASDGAADDLTISVTGATDSSVILSSSGTGADAISLQASAGGVDVDSAAGADTNVAGGQVALVSKDNAASAISLTANVGTSETIVVTNTQGTAEGAVTVTSTAGGVDIDGAAAKNVDIAGGQVLISSKDNAASAIALTANQGTSETIVVTNTQGTGEGAVTVTSTAGGVDVDAAAAKNVDISGGQVLLSSKDNAASAIALTANVGTSETILVTNTQGTSDAAINLTASAGGIDVNATKSLTLTSTEAQADAVVLEATAGGVDITTAASFDIDLTASGGTVQVIASEAAANQFKVDAQGTIAGYATVLETTDGGIQLNADGAANGDIDIDAADDMTLTAGGDLTLAVTGTVSAGGSSITNVLSDAEVVAAANVIAATECGKDFYLNDATEFASTLPALSGVSAGCRMRFIVGAAPSGASYTVITGNSLENQLYGLAVVNGASVAVSAGDTITFTDGAAVKGDWVEVRSDGTSWYVSGQGSAATAITLTQAD